jgi:hypothetical protein
LGPIIRPESINPKIAGIRNCLEKYGTIKMTSMISVKMATGFVIGANISNSHERLKISKKKQSIFFFIFEICYFIPHL